MKLNGIGASLPRLEQAPRHSPVEGSAGAGRLVAPTGLDAGAHAAWTGVQAPAPPLRFPWLSRQTQVLLETAGQRAGFEALPVLGDKLDTWT